MINAARQLAARALAALRDNPLVRYGSPARRVGVPRALWWLALGASLLVSVFSSLIDVGRGAPDPYLWMAGAAAVAMPLVAGIAFLGFGFPYRRPEHLDDLALAGLKPTDLLVGFLCWPVVACGLVVAPLVAVPWATAVATLLTNQVSQSLPIFGGRVLMSAALVLWTVLCLAVAARVWDRRTKRGWLVLFETTARCSVHLLWFAAPITGGVLGMASFVWALVIEVPQYNILFTGFAPGRPFGGPLWIWSAMIDDFGRDVANWFLYFLLLLAATVFELWRTWYCAVQSRLSTAPDDGARPVRPAPYVAPILPWWTRWSVTLPAGLAAFEVLNRLHNAAINWPPPSGTSMARPDVLGWCGLTLLAIGLVVGLAMIRAQGRSNTRWLADDIGLGRIVLSLPKPVFLLYVWVWARSRFHDTALTTPGSITQEFILTHLSSFVLGMLHLCLLLAFVVGTLRPPGRRWLIAAAWLLLALAIYLPPWGGWPTTPWGKQTINSPVSLLSWNPGGGRQFIEALVVTIFLAFGWRACAMWFELTKHRLVGPEGEPR